MVIRVAVPGDRDVVLTMMLAFCVEEGVQCHAEAKRALEDLLADPRIGGVLLAERDGETAGYVIVTFGYSLEMGGRDAFVDELFVRPEHRRRGLGRALLCAAIDHAREKGAHALHLEVAAPDDAKLGFYRALGFTARPHPQYRVMPWKNGLGTTTEIAVHPPGAGLDEFTWRVSIADLAASGPFSTFAGCDRILVQLEGAPMTLVHEGRGEHRLGLLAPYRFAGELGTYGALDAPPARDFNVMVCRERASAQVFVHALAPREAVRAEGEAETRLVYVLRGAIAAHAAGETCALAAKETLVAMDAGELVLTGAAEDTVAIVVSIGAPGQLHDLQAGSSSKVDDSIAT